LARARSDVEVRDIVLDAWKQLPPIEAAAVRAVAVRHWRRLSAQPSPVSPVSPGATVRPANDAPRTPSPPPSPAVRKAMARAAKERRKAEARERQPLLPLPATGRTER
jgi:hypothetical protein